MEGDGKEVINLDPDEGETDLNSESGTPQPESSSSSSGSTSKRYRITRAVKEILTASNNEFLSNFDPESSNREKRKLTRKFTIEAKKNGSLYDENGVLNVSQKDVCDCLTEDCPGCHFPCPKCRSCKCGIECRVNRKWTYEVIENEGELAIRNSNTGPTS